MDIDVDPFDDLTDGAANTAKGSSKFQPKAKFRPARKPVAAASVSESQPQSTLDTVPSGTEAGAAKPSNASNNFVPEDNGGRNTSIEKSVGVTSDIFIGLEDHGGFFLDATNLETNIPPPESPGINDSSSRDPGTGETNVLNVGESMVSSCMGYSKTNNQELRTGEMEVLRSDPEHIAGKFQAGLDVDARMHEETCEATVSCSPNPFEFNETAKNSIPTLNQDDVLDLSSLGFTDLLAGEDVLGYDSLANDGGWNEKERSDPSQQQMTSTDRRDKETVLALRRKNQATRLVDDIDGEVLADMELSRECPSRTLEEGNSIDAEHRLENEECRETIRNASDKGPTARKRKKSDEAAPSTNQKPKRFPHSTRRRRVNKALLEIPEDEIDYESIPLRDIILLAEHKEKQLKKEEAETRASAKNSGSGTSHAEGENHDAEDNPDLNDTTLYFNYQTYMNKPRTIRWSKKDNELFYEAVQQFGTDLSMIQQLFPELTRHQIKLKYKKEERQHPMRLQQALSSRSKDHSHYKNVIERLKQAAAEENRNADNEEETDGQAEESSLAHDEEANEDENGGENGYDVQSESLSKEEEQGAAEEKDDDVEYFQYTSL